MITLFNLKNKICMWHEDLLIKALLGIQRKVSLNENGSSLKWFAAGIWIMVAN